MGRPILLSLLVLLSFGGGGHAAEEIEESVAGVIMSDAPSAPRREKTPAKHNRRVKSKADQTPIWQQNGSAIDPHGVDGY